MVDPEDDFRRLIDSTLEVAEDLLAKGADFWPFAAFINLAGEDRLVTSDGQAGTPKDEYPFLLQGAKALRKDTRAFALCRAVEFRLQQDDPPADAVEITLEHAAYEPVLVLYPYERSAEHGITWQPPQSFKGERRIYRPSGLRALLGWRQ